MTDYCRSHRLPAIPRLAVIAAAALAANAARAGEISGSATLASEYVYRGQNLSEGNPALQLGIDYEHDSGLFAGAWASTVDLPNPAGRRDTEIDYYIGYHYMAKAPVSFSASIMRYTYPGQTGVRDYDFTEAFVTVMLHSRYSIEIGYSDDMYGWERIGRHVELRADWPLQNAWVVSAGLGHSDIEALGTTNYIYGDLGVSARFSHLTVDLRWYNNESTYGTLAGLSAGSQFVVSLSAAF